MKVDLPDTTTSQISKTLVRIREEGGAVALGRVLTLVISTDLGQEEHAIEAANDASREHPMRVIVVSTAPAGSADVDDMRLDAQIRVGGDAGASEVIVLKAYGDMASDEEGLVTGLLLPDAPVVAWWPGAAPEVVSASPLGRIAQRRITDAAAQPDPCGFLEHLGDTYMPGDTDFSWTRLTLWRAQLAAVLDQPPFESITAAEVHGAADSVLHECTPEVAGSSGIHGVKLVRQSGTIALERTQENIATLVQPNQPIHDISLPRRSLRECLAEELRRLDPDDLFGEVITAGLKDLAVVVIVDAADDAPAAGDAS